MTMTTFKRSVIMSTFVSLFLLWCIVAQAGEIHEAAQTGNLAKVKEILKRDFSQVNSKDNARGGTALHYAVGFEHIEIVRLLLEKGANVNALSNNGSSPLHVAAEQGFTEIAKLLVSQGADVNIKSNGTPLHLAAQKGNKEIVSILLSKGADVNAKSADRYWTPLHFAAAYGHKEIVELLLAKGADVNAKDKEGGTPAHYAKDYGYKNIVSLLESKGANASTKMVDVPFTHFRHNIISFDYPQYFVVPDKNRVDVDHLKKTMKDNGIDLLFLRQSPDAQTVLQVIRSTSQSSLDALYQEKKTLADQINREGVKIQGDQFIKFTVNPVTLSGGQKALLENGEKANGEVAVTYELLLSGSDYAIMFIYKDTKIAEEGTKLRDRVIASLKRETKK